MSTIARFFKFEERNTNLGTETRAGLATFLTMAYILFVNPDILKSAGVPFNGAVVATAVAAGITSILMGLFANFPLALASGMGLNAFVAYTVVIGHKVSWQIGMGLVFLDGLIVLTLVLVGLRKAVMNAIPLDLKRAIAVGIGLFLAFIGLVNSRLVIVDPSTLSILKGIPLGGPLPALPPVKFGDVTAPGPLITIFGILITGFFLVKKIKGSILLGIIASTILALIVGISTIPKEFIVPDFSTFGQLDILGALKLSFLPLLIGFLIVDFFDTLGTVTAIADRSGLIDKDGNIQSIGRILGIDALGAIFGGLFGASSVTSYIESAAGVSEGGRTGFSAIIVGLLFLAGIFLAPIAKIVPSEATAPALIIIGFLIMSVVREIDFEKYDTAIPAFITMISMPLTYSISRGVGYGFITYVVLKVLSGKFREVHPLMYVVALIFALTFAFIPTA